MQLKFANYLTELHRGDNWQQPLFINEWDRFHIKQYILRPGDKVYMSIAEPNQVWEDSAISDIPRILQ